MASSNTSMVTIETAQIPTSFKEQDVMASALTKFDNQLFLDGEIFQALNYQETLQSQIQGFPGNMLGAVTLEMFEQPLEALGGLLGRCPVKKLPEFGEGLRLGVNSNTPAASCDPNSSQILDTIKQLLIDQQESIVSLLKEQLQELSTHDATKAPPKQEGSRSSSSTRGVHQGWKSRPTRVAIDRLASQPSPTTVQDSVRHRPAYSYKPRAKKELRTGANAVPLGLKSSSHLDSSSVASIEDFDALVEIIRSPDLRSLRVQHCAGFYHQMSTHQHCSRVLQEMIKVAPQADIAKICDEVVPHMEDLAFHPSGNYIVQKLIVHGDAGIKKGLFGVFQNNMMCLIDDACGCRVAQAAIQHLDENDAATLAGELDGHLADCIRSHNGNHVVQACITHLPISKLSFLMDFVAAEAKHLAVHPFGCRILQRILKKPENSTGRTKVLEAIVDVCECLAVDPYANYIVQNALEYGTIAVRSKLVKAMAPNIHILSCDKFGSNVVEKCLAKGSTGDVEILIRSALDVGQESEGLRGMAEDRFGNYVVQTMIGMANETQRGEIISRLDSPEKLRNRQFGRAIARLLEKKDYLGW